MAAFDPYGPRWCNKSVSVVMRGLQELCDVVSELTEHWAPFIKACEVRAGHRSPSAPIAFDFRVVECGLMACGGLSERLLLYKPIHMIQEVVATRAGLEKTLRQDREVARRATSQLNDMLVCSQPICHQAS